MLSSQISSIIPATGKSLRSSHRIPRRLTIMNRAGKTYDLVFEGGGAKGIAFIGTLQALGKAEHKVGRLLGTSAGAITATMLCLGYKESELVKILAEKTPDGKSVLSTFNDVPTSFEETTYNESRIAETVDDLRFVPGFLKRLVINALIGIFMSTSRLRSVFSLVEKGGLYKGDAFYNWFVSQIDKKYPGQGETLTFDQLFKINGQDLTVCASNVTQQMLMALNHRTAPALPIAKAVRMSMSVPFYWQEVIWDESWGKYDNIDVAGDVVVDGAVLSNIPLELFLSNEKFVTDIMGPKSCDIIMGCSLDDTLAPKNYDVNQKKSRFDEIKTLQRVGSLVNVMMKANDKVYLQEYAELVARCPTKGLGLFEFDVDETKRNLFIDAAYAATMNTIKHIDSSSLDHVSKEEVNQHSELLDPVVHCQIAVGEGSAPGSEAQATETAMQILQHNGSQKKYVTLV